MQLRSRAVGSDSPFSKLPIEIWQMIWRLTIEPLVVELKHKRTYWEESGASRDTEAPADEASKIRYYSPATLPTALFVCSGSRQAVLPLYPLCFASETHDPAVRFNFSLDTLYIERGFEDALVRFLDGLGIMEATRVERFGVSFMIGVGPGEDDDWNEDDIWTNLGSWIDKFTGLKEKVLIVRDIGSHAGYAVGAWGYDNTPERQDDLMQLANSCDPNWKSMELHDNYPDELVRRFNFTEDEIPEGTNRVERWILSKARVVWSWRREYYPAFLEMVKSDPVRRKCFQL